MNTEENKIEASPIVNFEDKEYKTKNQVPGIYVDIDKNIIVEINDDENIRVNSNYTWMSHNQVLHFLKKGIFNIEARILFACFNIKNIL